MKGRHGGRAAPVAEAHAGGGDGDALGAGGVLDRHAGDVDGGTVGAGDHVPLVARVGDDAIVGVVVHVVPAVDGDVDVDGVAVGEGEAGGVLLEDEGDVGDGGGVGGDVEAGGAAVAGIGLVADGIVEGGVEGGADRGDGVGADEVALVLLGEGDLGAGGEGVDGGAGGVGGRRLGGVGDGGDVAGGVDEDEADSVGVGAAAEVPADGGGAEDRLAGHEAGLAGALVAEVAEVDVEVAPVARVVLRGAVGAEGVPLALGVGLGAGGHADGVLGEPGDLLGGEGAGEEAELVDVRILVVARADIVDSAGGGDRAGDGVEATADEEVGQLTLGGHARVGEEAVLGAVEVEVDARLEGAIALRVGIVDQGDVHPLALGDGRPPGAVLPIGGVGIEAELVGPARAAEAVVLPAKDEAHDCAGVAARVIVKAHEEGEGEAGVGAAAETGGVEEVEAVGVGGAGQTADAVAALEGVVAEAALAGGDEAAIVGAEVGGDGDGAAADADVDGRDVAGLDGVELVEVEGVEEAGAGLGGVGLLDDLEALQLAVVVAAGGLEGEGGGGEAGDDHDADALLADDAGLAVGAPVLRADGELAILISIGCGGAAGRNLHGAEMVAIAPAEVLVEVEDEGVGAVGDAVEGDAGGALGVGRGGVEGREGGVVVLVVGDGIAAGDAGEGHGHALGHRAVAVDDRAVAEGLRVGGEGVPVGAAEGIAGHAIEGVGLELGAALLEGEADGADAVGEGLVPGGGLLDELDAAEHRAGGGALRAVVLPGDVEGEVAVGVGGQVGDDHVALGLDDAQLAIDVGVLDVALDRGAAIGADVPGLVDDHGVVAVLMGGVDAAAEVEDGGELRVGDAGDGELVEGVRADGAAIRVLALEDGHGLGAFLEEAVAAGHDGVLGGVVGGVLGCNSQEVAVVGGDGEGHALDLRAGVVMGGLEGVGVGAGDGEVVPAVAGDLVGGNAVEAVAGEVLGAGLAAGAEDEADAPAGEGGVDGGGVLVGHRGVALEVAPRIEIGGVGIAVGVGGGGAAEVSGAAAEAAEVLAVEDLPVAAVGGDLDGPLDGVAGAVVGELDAVAIEGYGLAEVGGEGGGGGGAPSFLVGGAAAVAKLVVEDVRPRAIALGGAAGDGDAGAGEDGPSFMKGGEEAERQIIAGDDVGGEADVLPGAGLFAGGDLPLGLGHDDQRGVGLRHVVRCGIGVGVPDRPVGAVLGDLDAPGQGHLGALGLEGEEIAVDRLHRAMKQQSSS